MFFPFNFVAFVVILTFVTVVITGAEEETSSTEASTDSLTDAADVLRDTVPESTTRQPLGNVEEPLACHKVHNENNRANAATIKIIDEELQILYNYLNKSGEYMDPCTYTLSAQGGEPIEVMNTLEKFEQQRNKYQRGHWGYCSKNGSDELIQNIKDFQTRALQEMEDGVGIILCNKAKLLMCHPKFQLCQCLVESRNFRTIASQFWDDDEEPNVASQCMLVSGSDCSIGTVHPCVPGTSCRIKKAPQLECSSENVMQSLGRETSSRLLDTSNSETESEHRHRREAQDVQENDVAESTTTEDGQVGNKSMSMAANSDVKLSAESSGHYSVLPDDSYPSVHCHCILTQDSKTDNSGANDLKLVNMRKINFLLGIGVLLLEVN